jgi:type IV secretion system protein VirB3
MAKDEGKVVADSLFVGLTRPTLMFGVSFQFALLNFLIGVCGIILSSNPSVLLLAIPTHVAGFYLTSKEPRFVELFITRSQKCNKCKNRFYHGANSYDPF